MVREREGVRVCVSRGGGYGQDKKDALRGFDSEPNSGKHIGSCAC